MGCALVLLPLSMVIATMYYPCLSLRYDDDAVVHCFNPSLCYPDGDHQRQNRDHLLVALREKLGSLWNSQLSHIGAGRVVGSTLSCLFNGCCLIAEP